MIDEGASQNRDPPKHWLVAFWFPLSQHPKGAPDFGHTHVCVCVVRSHNPNEAVASLQLRMNR